MQDRARERNTEMTGFGSSLVALRLGIWYCHCYGKQLPHAEGVAKKKKKMAGQYFFFNCPMSLSISEFGSFVFLLGILDRT